MTAAGFPSLSVQIAFASVYNDTTPTWVDVVGHARSFSSSRGRPDERGTAEPGTCSVVLSDPDGRYYPDNASGPYYGNLRPNKRVRLGVTISGTFYPIFTGWAESFTPSPDQQTCTVEAVDRFGLMSRQKDTLNSRPDEYADVRITALLQHFGIGSGDRVINAAGLAARTVATHDYDDEVLLDTLLGAAFSDGGLLFMDAYGRVTFQTVTYRQIGGATAARTSQARFGNDATAVPVEADVAPQINRTLMANRVTITDCNGDVQTAEDTALQAAGDGLMVLDLGDSLLLTADALDRVADELALRKNPTLRYDHVTTNVLSLTSAEQVSVFARELSDRITLAIIPPNLTSGTARDQWIEGVSHDVQITGDPSWTTTFQLSSAGDAVTVIP